jgi:hypothetical protein
VNIESNSREVNVMSSNWVRENAVAVGMTMFLALPSDAQSSGGFNSSPASVPAASVGFSAPGMTVERAATVGVAPLALPVELHALVNRMWRTSLIPP